LGNFQERILESYVQGNAAYDRRLSVGTQPNFPYIDLYHVVLGNCVYFGVTLVLYLVMSQRKYPLPHLRPFIAVYNAICVVLAGAVVYGILQLKMKNPGTFACNLIDESKDGQQMGWVFWLFYAQKYWEFCDTWFFILRKSTRQVTFLHLYHHCSITWLCAIVLPYDYSGDMYLPALLNSIVHVLMYSHYLATILGVNSWWRHYLTSLQLIQFALIFSQNSYSLWKGSECGSPDFCKLVMMMYMFSMLLLFGNFYVKRYLSEEVPPAGASPEKARKKLRKED